MHAGGDGGKSTKPRPLTPIRLFVDLQPLCGVLRWLAVAAEAVSHKQGGPALDQLHALTLHGDPAVHKVWQPCHLHASDFGS